MTIALRYWSVNFTRVGNLYNMDCDLQPSQATVACAPSELAVLPSHPMVNDEPMTLIKLLRDEMISAAASGYSGLRSVLPAAVLCKALEDGYQLFKKEATLVEVNLSDPSIEVVVVGDTHGQFHDFCKMLDFIGWPNAKRIFIFNGDFVDRGAWGVELMAMLLSLKLAYPSYVYMLRGNHESSNCTLTYGFKAEIETKYSQEPFIQDCLSADVPQGMAPPIHQPHADAKAIYKAFKRLFSVLPLAALVQSKTLILHGGLFRRPPQARKRQRKPNLVSQQCVELGTLDDLRAASKGGMDPAGDVPSTVIAADIMWSDPIMEPGMQFNESRGVGVTFGPDITQRFLEANGLSLIIRSHEGPDARSMRPEMAQVTEGYALDHTSAAGNLVTLFSAPDYPQFQDGDSRYNNKGAVAVLTAPDYCTPNFKSFEACLPRPKALAFYNFFFSDTDDEDPQTEASCSIGGSASMGSGMSYHDDEAHGVVESSRDFVSSGNQQLQVTSQPCQGDFDVMPQTLPVDITEALDPLLSTTTAGNNIDGAINIDGTGNDIDGATAGTTAGNDIDGTTAGTTAGNDIDGAINRVCVAHHDGSEQGPSVTDDRKEPGPVVHECMDDLLLQANSIEPSIIAHGDNMLPHLSGMFPLETLPLEKSS